MKKITKKDVVNAVERFSEIKEQMKAFEKEHKELRASLMAALGDEHLAMVGEYLLIVSQRVRTDLDKEALAIELGCRLPDFQKQSTYDVLDVKKA